MSDTPIYDALVYEWQLRAGRFDVGLLSSQQEWQARRRVTGDAHDALLLSYAALSRRDPWKELARRYTPQENWDWEWGYTGKQGTRFGVHLPGVSVDLVDGKRITKDWATGEVSVEDIDE